MLKNNIGVMCALECWQPISPLYGVFTLGTSKCSVAMLKQTQPCFVRLLSLVHAGERVVLTEILFIFYFIDTLSRSSNF